MDKKETKSRKKGGLIAVGCAVLAVIIIVILLLTRCDGGSGNAVSASELAEQLAAEGDAVIQLDDDVVIDGPIIVNGNKTITGDGTIVLSTQLEGNWPETDAPTWGMGCAKLEAEDGTAMPAMLNISEGCSLTLGGNVTVDAQGNANGVLVGDKAELNFSENAVVKNGRYANLVVYESASAALAGGSLLDGSVYNVINYGAVELSGTNVNGAAAGASIYTTGSVNQTGGNVAGAAFHNVYVAQGTYTMTGGTNEGAAKDGIVVAEGASADVTGGSITNCVHGLCNNGTMNGGVVALSECGIMNYGTGVLDLKGTTVDTSEVYCLANNGGVVTAEDFTASKCDTCAVYNFSGDMTLKNLTVTGSRDGNISNAGGNLTVDGATLDVCRDKSITVGNGKAVMNNVTIKGTTNNKYGVYAFGGELILNDSAIEGVSSSAVKADPGSYVELNNVTIKDAEQNGFQSDGGKIVGNNVTMENMGSHGIYNNGGDITVNGLTVDTVKKNGVQNKSGTTTLNGVELSNTGNHGAYVQTGTLTVTDGTFSTMAANGFYLPDGDGKLVLENVSIADTVQQGINNNANVEAKNVTITGTGMNGIYNKVGGTVTIDGLTVSDVAEHGINNKDAMTAANVTIKNTGAGSNGIQNNGTMTLTTASVTNSKNHGLYNTGKLTASGVSVNGTTKNGVYNAEKGNASIDGLTISATGEHGINNAAQLAASDVTIKNTGADKNGIQNSGTLTLEGADISASKNHGIYNTGTISGSDVTVSDTAKNGIYNNGGTVDSLKGVTVTNTGDQGINNAGSFTASQVTISKTAANGVYSTGGNVTLTDLKVSEPGGHGVSNDTASTMTIVSATLNGSAYGSNCVQNKGTMTLTDVTATDSQNHGIYNNGTLTTTGSLTVTNARVNGFYNDNGTADVASLSVSGTVGEHGVNNAGTLTVGKLTVNGVTANGIQNTKTMTLTGSAVLTNSGKHGIYNGDTFEGCNITIENAGDLLLSNGGDMVINGLDLSGTAHKAVYNAGYAELYTVSVDGTEVSYASAQYLIDNNGGILDLTDATILNANGTALHNRGKANASVTNVIIDHAGNYGIFVEGGSTLSGDGLVVNNVVKGTAVSGAEGIAIKNAGKITMMDHVTIGAYDDDVTGSGITIDKSSTGIPNNNAIVNDAATASYSGYDLTIKNTPNGSAIYNKGITYITDLTVEDSKVGVYTRYDSAMTLSGTVSISNLTDYAMRTQGDENSKGYKNSITLTEGAKLTIENVGGHGIYNGGTFTSLTKETITISKPGSNGIQSGAGAGVIDIAGAVVIDQPGAHAIYNKGQLTTGDLTITSATRKGISNDGGKITVNGDLTVDGTKEEAILNKGTLNVIGTATVKNIVGQKVNAVHNDSGKSITTGGLTIATADVTVNADNQGNGLYNLGTVTIKGNVDISGIKHEGNTTNDTKYNGIYNTGTINVEGTATVKIDTVMRHGINNNGGTINASGTSFEIRNTAKCGITISSGSFYAGDIVIANAGSHGINNKGTLEAASISVKDVGANDGENGVNNNGGTLKVTGAIKVENVTGRGVSNNNTLTAGSVFVKNAGTAGTQNGIQNTKTMTVSGAVEIDTTTGHGIYSGISFTAASVTIQNTTMNGVNNGGNTFTVTGETKISNITGSDVNALQNTGTMTLGKVTIKNVNTTITKEKFGNAVFNSGTLTIKGDVDISGVKTASTLDKDNKCNGIFNSKTINVEGTVEIKIDDVQRHGISLDAGTINAENATFTISNTTQNGILMQNSSKLTAGTIQIKDSSNNGIQITDVNTLEADLIIVQGIKNHGLWMKNASQPAVTVGILVAYDCDSRGLSANNDMTTDNLTVTAVYWLQCSEGVKSNLTDCVTNIYNYIPTTEAEASVAEEN